MKQSITLSTLPPHIQFFIKTWKKKKGYGSVEQITIGETIELIIATSRNLRNDDSDGRFFNKILLNQESSIGWDGEELIDILLFEAVDRIKQYFKRGTYNEPVS